MKDKIRAIVMLAIAGICIYYGYSQRHDAEVQRAEVTKLQVEVTRLKQEAEAARVQATKLRDSLESERAEMNKRLEEAQKKK
jgi:hypothetical protein